MTAQVLRLCDYRRPRLRVVSDLGPLYDEIERLTLDLLRAQAQVNKRIAEVWSMGLIKWPT